MLPSPLSAPGVTTPPRAVLRRRLSALAAVALLSASAAACSSDGTVTGSSPSPSVDPYDVAASVQASESATAPVSLSAEDAALRATALAMEAPEKPAKMSENSPEGAVAAAEYFVSLYPYVYATGDLTEWDAMSEDGCVFCGSVHDNVTELHESGGWADPWSQTVTADSYGNDPDNDARFVVPIKVESVPGLVHTGADSRTPTSSATTRTESIKVQLIWTDDSWIVEEAQTA